MIKTVLILLLGCAIGIYVAMDLRKPTDVLYLFLTIVGYQTLAFIIRSTLTDSVKQMWHHAADYGRAGIHRPLNPRHCDLCPLVPEKPAKNL